MLGRRRRRRERDRDDAPAVSRAPSAVQARINLERDRAYRRQVRLIEDRREHHPEAQYRYPRALVRAAARIMVNVNTIKRRSRQGGRDRVPSTLRFDDAKRVAICVRRKERREVLHALNKTGRGSGGGKRRWSEYSDIRCK